MNRFFEKNNINPIQAVNVESSFERFLKSRENALTSNSGLERCSRLLESADMPDIWEDPKAVNSFENSFFDDLAYRLSKNDRDSKIIGLLRKRLGKSDPFLDSEKIKNILREKLENPDSVWGEDFWGT